MLRVEIRHPRKTMRLLPSPERAGVGGAAWGRQTGGGGCREEQSRKQCLAFAETERQSEEVTAWVTVHDGEVLILELENPFHDQLWQESKPSGWSLCCPLTAEGRMAGCLTSLDPTSRMELRILLAGRVWL